VLIDGAGDAWVVDIEGSWTDGWVDIELRETVAGDLRGLRKIDDFLRTAIVDSCTSW
jgi:hypothetical protein